MNPVPDIAKERAPFNWTQIVSGICGVFMLAWVLAGIYFEFKSHEKDMKVLKDRIEYVNDRIDKKTNPLKADIEGLQKQHK